MQVTTKIPFMENAAIIPEPLGVVLSISTWNFPFGKLQGLQTWQKRPKFEAVCTDYYPAALDFGQNNYPAVSWDLGKVFVVGREVVSLYPRRNSQDHEFLCSLIALQEILKLHPKIVN